MSGLIESKKTIGVCQILLDQLSLLVILFGIALKFFDRLQQRIEVIVHRANKGAKA